MDVKLRNYTPHQINLIGVGEIPSEGVARLSEERVEITIGIGEGISYTSIWTGGVYGLPDGFAGSGDIYIVSRPVAQYLELPCVVAPDRFIRDKEGNVTGCEGLCWFPPED